MNINIISIIRISKKCNKILFGQEIFEKNNIFPLIEKKISFLIGPKDIIIMEFLNILNKIILIILFSYFKLFNINYLKFFLN